MALTAKQESFAQAVAAGLSPSQAYMTVYDVGLNTSPASVSNDAYELTIHPAVSLRIAELRRIRQAAAEAELAWDQRQLVREAKANLDGSRAANQWGSANGALELIGRATGLLSDKPREIQAPITRVVIVLDRGRDADGHPQVVEAEYKVLPVTPDDAQVATAAPNVTESE